MTSKPIHKPGTWWQKVLAVCFVAVLVAKCNDLQQSKPVAATTISRDVAYREDFNLPLSKQIVKDGISGCGQMEWAQSASDERLYMVRCTRDGKNWISHVVRVQ